MSRRKRTVPPPVAPQQPASVRPEVVLLLLLGLTTLAFSPVLSCGLINLDDDVYVAANRYVQQGLNWESLHWAWTDTAISSNWHPLTWLSLMLDRNLFGPAPWGFHLTNLLFHLTGVAFLFYFLRSATGHLWRSALATALFAVHPLRVESVAWVAERKDVLSVCLGLAALTAYLGYVRKPGLRRYALVLLFLTLSLLAKATLVTLPAVLLLLDYWPLKRGKTVRLSRLLGEKIPFAFLSAAFAVGAFLAQRSGGAVRSIQQVDIASRLANTLVSYVRYLGKMVWFTNLGILYPLPHSWPVAEVVGSGALLLAISAAIWWRRRRQPFLAVGWFWFVGTLLPMIGLVQIGTQALADRYTYFPGIGLALLAAWAIPDSALTTIGRRVICAVAAIGGVLILSLFTFIQAGYWHDSVTLFEHTLAVTQDNYLIHNNLGAFFARLGDNEQALAHYNWALAINPAFPPTYNNLGIVLDQTGQNQKAIATYRQALRLDPRYAEAHYNLGVALEKQQRWEEVAACYHQALTLKPDYAKAYYRLGLALEHLGRVQEALAAYQNALRWQPDFADARVALRQADKP